MVRPFGETRGDSYKYQTPCLKCSRLVSTQAIISMDPLLVHYIFASCVFPHLTLSASSLAWSDIYLVYGPQITVEVWDMTSLLDHWNGWENLWCIQRCSECRPRCAGSQHLPAQYSWLPAAILNQKVIDWPLSWHVKVCSVQVAAVKLGYKWADFLISGQ